MINEKLTDKSVLRHVEYVFSGVRKIFPNREILQAIRGPLVPSVGEWARHVQVFGRRMAGISIQFYVPAHALVDVDDILITRD